MTSYKIISKDHPNELWASGFRDKEKAEAHIPKLRRHMYQADREKELTVVEETRRPMLSIHTSRLHQPHWWVRGLVE